MNQAFASRIRTDGETGCWIWTGGTCLGYGWMRWKGKQGVAHRFLYEEMVGPIPKGRQLSRTCPNRDCVRPEHWMGNRVDTAPRRVTSRGYVVVRNEHGEQVYEHRLVMERVLSRPLQTTEHVHHVNGDRADNRPGNLVVLMAGDHVILHNMPINKWARHYDACIRCGTNERPHDAHGMCKRCNERSRAARVHFGANSNDR